MEDSASETPLVDLLRGVDIEGATSYRTEDGGYHIVPVGQYCHAAADRIAELEAEVERLRASQEVTGGLVKCAPLVMGDAVFAGIDEDDIAEIPRAIVVQFANFDDIRKAIRGEPVVMDVSAALSTGEVDG